MLCHQRQLNGPSDQNGPNCQLPSEYEIIIRDWDGQIESSIYGKIIKRKQQENKEIAREINTILNFGINIYLFLFVLI
jgi:hypothetical protein